MSDLQIGLLAIGALVVAGVLAYNRVQENRAKRDAERSFRSDHQDVLIGGASQEAAAEASRTPVEVRDSGRGMPIPDAAGDGARPDPAIDYVVTITAEQPLAAGAFQEHWGAIGRRHARRTLLARLDDGRRWEASLQLVSRDGAVGEADLIEFRSAVETLAASVGASVSAPEMRAAVEAARALDDFCAEADIQVVVHVQGGPFQGAAVKAAAEAGGLALEDHGRFALRDAERRLVYTLGARDGSPFVAAGMAQAAPGGLTLSLDLARAPDTRRSFESMARLAHHLVATLGGSLVDDNGTVLDERAIAAIAQQLDAVSARLEAHGVAPGSAAALRLFS